MDPADQTLVGDSSQDADVLVVKEVAVSGFPILGLSSSPTCLLRFDALLPFVLPFPFLFPRSLWRSSESMCSLRSSIYSLQ